MKPDVTSSRDYSKTQIVQRFKFRLDPLIRYRQHRYRMALMDVAKAKRALIETTKRIRQIEQSRKATARELGNEEAQGIGVDYYRTYAAYLDRLRREIESENERLIEISKTVKEKHKAAEAERISKETLEWVKQTEYANYMQMVNRAEQKATDELVGLRRKTKKL